MPSVIQKLTDKKLISPPNWLPTNIQYEVIMGSQAYGVSSDNSDLDIYGFAIPPKDYIFPNLAGIIPGFGNQGQRFEQFQQHHVKVEAEGRNYDFCIMNIVKYFELARQCNPNIIDSLFVPQTCVLTQTTVGNMVRENRRLFLSKQCWPKFKGYAYSMIKHVEGSLAEGLDDVKEIRALEDELDIEHSMKFEEVQKAVFGYSSSPSLTGLCVGDLMRYYKLFKEGVTQSKRFEDRKKNGYDTKYVYHLVRLLNEVEQILTTGDLDVQQNREQLKNIRAGGWTLQQVRSYFAQKEKDLETVYSNSKLPAQSDELRLRQLLLDCLETHYGSLAQVIVKQEEVQVALREIDDILQKLKEKELLFPRLKI